MPRDLKTTLMTVPGGSKIRSAWFHLQKLPENIISRLAPGRHYEQRKQAWNDRWSKEDFTPAWMADHIPEELQYAIDSEWFTPGCSVLDIGCGDGKIAHWLAQNDYRVFAFDYVAPAVEKAELLYGSDKIDFAVLDATNMPPPEHKYQAIFDRGCFHIIPEKFWANYSQGVADWAQQGAKFLLLTSTRKGPKISTRRDEVLRQQMTDQIINTFSPHFEINEIKNAPMLRESGKPDTEPLDGIAAMMTRL